MESMIESVAKMSKLIDIGGQDRPSPQITLSMEIRKSQGNKAFFTFCTMALLSGLPFHNV